MGGRRGLATDRKMMNKVVDDQEGRRPEADPGERRLISPKSIRSRVPEAAAWGMVVMMESEHQACCQLEDRLTALMLLVSSISPPKAKLQWSSCGWMTTRRATGSTAVDVGDILAKMTKLATRCKAVWKSPAKTHGRTTLPSNCRVIKHQWRRFLLHEAVFGSFAKVKRTKLMKKQPYVRNF